MAKNRDINELRQTKDAHYVHPTFQGGDFIKPTNKPAKTTEEVMNPSKYTENDLEQAKCSIVEKIIKHFNDTLFEIVCEEMSNNYLFNSDNYLTEAGYDIFEDEWFEFYHEHHGDILHQVKQSLTN
jgi:hypothetical protein